MDELTANDSEFATGNLPIVTPEDVEPLPEDAAPELVDETALDEPAVDEVTWEDFPEVSATPSAVLTDAKSRSLRTLAQGALMTVLTAGALVLYPVIQSGDVSHVDWKALALVALQAVGTALFSYAQRVLGKGPAA